LERSRRVPTLAVHRPDGPPEIVELARPLTAGGSRGDGVVLPGCPPGALRLVPCAAGVIAEALARGVRAGGRAVPAGARRLVRAGERIELHGSAIAPVAAAEEGTRAAAGALLRDAAAGAAPPAGAHLVVLSGPAAGARHALGEEQTLGRGRTASIAIPDARASRVHARIRVGAAGVTVEDLGSKNGVRVNGVRIDRHPRALRPGDELAIGDTELALAAGPLEDRATPSPRRGPPAPILAAALLAASAVALALAAR
jgi:hypothetical protein